jgi:hypothetical protein
MNLDDLTITFQAEVLPEHIDDNGHMNVSWYSTMAYMDMNVRRMTAFPLSAQREIDRLVGVHANLDWAAPVCGSMKP